MRMPPLLSRTALAAAACAALAFAPLHSHAQGGVMNLLNSLGVAPRDLSSIFQQLKESGSLHAELEFR